jgi:hypothetical protein
VSTLDTGVHMPAAVYGATQAGTIMSAFGVVNGTVAVPTELLAQLLQAAFLAGQAHGMEQINAIRQRSNEASA